jgi:uncharacterized protein (DUF169 family)
MKNNDFRRAVDRLYCSLELERRAVGVAFVYSEEAFNREEILLPKKPINYCQMVSAASYGHAMKATKDEIKCMSGCRTLGLSHLDEKNANGENWARLGLYKDETIAKSIRESLTYNKKDVYGIIVKPLEMYEECPDVILIVSVPYQIMRIMQGYAYSYGMPTVNMLGNQAICYEATARVHVTNEINCSLLCIGTRHRSSWKDDEMVVGIPKSKFIDTVSGIWQTINSMESDENKRKIERKLTDRASEKNIAKEKDTTKEKDIAKEKNTTDENTDALNIRYGYNYYMDC